MQYVIHNIPKQVANKLLNLLDQGLTFDIPSKELNMQTWREDVVTPEIKIVKNIVLKIDSEFKFGMKLQ